MNEPFVPATGWVAKFSNAFRGIYVGVRSQLSFIVHMPAMVTVLVVATVVQLDTIRWLLLTLCIFAVLAAELFNSSIESLAKAVTREENAHVRDALDVASGAVLMVAIGAAVVGLAVLVPPLWRLAGG